MLTTVYQPTARASQALAWKPSAQPLRRLPRARSSPSTPRSSQAARMTVRSSQLPWPRPRKPRPPWSSPSSTAWLVTSTSSLACLSLACLSCAPICQRPTAPGCRCLPCSLSGKPARSASAPKPPWQQPRPAVCAWVAQHHQLAAKPATRPSSSAQTRSCSACCPSSTASKRRARPACVRSPQSCQPVAYKLPAAVCNGTPARSATCSQERNFWRYNHA
jgi:hypothetical protein